MRAPLDMARNVAQHGDALELLRALPDGCASLGFSIHSFASCSPASDTENEGERQGGRAKLPAMSTDYIDAVVREFARVLAASGYLMRWTDKFCLCEGHHLRIPSDLLKVVDLITTDHERIGQGYRTRYRGDFLLVMQKPPIKARATWRDHAIPDRWIERVDRSVHPHVKPTGLISRLITAVTVPNDLVVDPAAGSFAVLYAARALGREFLGCDLAFDR